MDEERKPFTLREIERFTVLDAVARNHGNKSIAARELGISRTTLYRKLEEIGTSNHDDVQDAAVGER